MADNLTPALKRLLMDAGCQFERHGKRRSRYLVQPAYVTPVRRGFTHSLKTHGKCGSEAGGTAEAILKAQRSVRKSSMPANGNLVRLLLVRW